MDNQKIIDEARRMVDGDDVPLWAVAAALQLGYTGDGAVLHVAQVVLKWHDLHGNDQALVWATRGAREMQFTIADGPAWSDEDRPYILELDPAEVARRALELCDEDAYDKAREAMNEISADRSLS